jgi:hypothetical protein
MSKSTPAAPDYRGAAEETAQSSRENIEQQTWANRPDQNTPFGQSSWESTPTWDPSTGQYINRWTQNTTLNDQSQRALDAQMGLTTGRSELAGSLMPRMKDEFGNEMDWSQFDQMGGRVGAQDLSTGYERAGPELDSSERYNQQANEAIYNQWADRALPQQEERRNQMQTQLYNQGLKPGDQAYDREMEKLGQQQGDEMRQAQYQATIGSGAEAQRMLGMDAATRAQLTGENAALAGFGNQAMGQQFGQNMQSSGYDTQRRQQQITEEMSRRGFSLNEINAIISGQQVGMPSMPNFNQAAAAQATDYSGAAGQQGQADLDRFNAGQAAQQGMMSGVGSLAGGFMMSDRRLKKNIKRIGSHNGINIYAFDYVWGHPGVGVMSDEVRHIPGAVVTHSSGYDAVNYEVIYGG